MPLNRQGGRVRAPLGGGRAKTENSSRRHPRKFGVKRFLVVREVAGAVSGVALFWATSLEKIFGGGLAIISFRPGGWMQQSAVPRCAILSEAREASGSEAPRVHHASRQRDRVAAGQQPAMPVIGCFAPSTEMNGLTPVRLAPGWLRLATRPSLTGSPPVMKMIGIVVLAALAARAETPPPPVAITAIVDARGRPQAPAVYRIGPPPIGIRSRRFGLQ